MSLLQEFVVGLSNDLGTDGTGGGKDLHDRLRLKANHGLSEDWMVYAASARPRDCTIFDLQTQKIKTLKVCLLPIGAGVYIVLK